MRRQFSLVTTLIDICEQVEKDGPESYTEVIARKCAKS